MTMKDTQTNTAAWELMSFYRGQGIRPPVEIRDACRVVMLSETPGSPEPTAEEIALVNGAAGALNDFKRKARGERK